MTSISASTTYKKSGKSPNLSKATSPATKSPASMSRNSSSSSLYSLGGGGSRRMSKRPSSSNLQQQERGIAQKLEGLTITSEAHMASLKLSDADVVADTFKGLLDAAMGVEKFNPNPHTASDTKSRSTGESYWSYACK